MDDAGNVTVAYRHPSRNLNRFSSAASALTADSVHGASLFFTILTRPQHGWLARLVMLMAVNLRLELADVAGSGNQDSLRTYATVIV